MPSAKTLINHGNNKTILGVNKNDTRENITNRLVNNKNGNRNFN